MRNNQPITGAEIEVEPDALIVSRTDAAGRITYVNQDFIRYSGFTEAECLGAPHNIVRHPDMPREVFADLWACLTSGLPWVGIIKNRVKNGDAYWVEAHVAPVRDGDEIKGYLSVRYRAAPEAIAQARRDYEAMQGNQRLASGFRHGKLDTPNWLGHLSRWLGTLTLASKMALAGLGVAAILLITGVTLLSWYVTGVLDANARSQLQDDVSLAQELVTSRIEEPYRQLLESAHRVAGSLGDQADASSLALRAQLAFVQARESGLPPIQLCVLRKGRDGFEPIVLSADSPADKQLWAEVLRSQAKPLEAGIEFDGALRMNGRHFLMAVVPVSGMEDDAQVLAAVAMDVTAQLDSLNKQLGTFHVGSHGYYFVVDATPGTTFGTFLVHPFKRGQSIAEYSDRSGTRMMEVMTGAKNGVFDYRWRNEEAGESEFYDKVMHFGQIDHPGWIVAGSMSLSEFTALATHLRRFVSIGGALLCIAVLASLLALVRLLVLRPLQGTVLPAFQDLASAKFKSALDIRGKDEIVQVLQGLEILKHRLAYESQREQALVRLSLEAREAAESLSTARADFLANMSHEIRTPLNAIIGLTYLMRQATAEDRRGLYLDRIEGAGKLLLSIVNDVLDFSKIDSGTLKLDSARFTIDKLLEDVSSLLRPRAQEKNLSLEYLVDPEIPRTAIGDELRLSQVLLNLIGNAIKFTATGSVIVFVRADQAREGRSLFEFRIQDSGIGLTPEQQGRLFHAFAQADTSVTRKYGGTGLGLTICKRLVEMMDGRIWVESVLGEGATFTFTVQLGVDESARIEVPEAFRRALIVDDNIISRRVLSGLILQLGFRPQTAESGGEALDILRSARQPYDCILLDLHMPDMDGIALARQIRREFGHGARLILVTGDDLHSTKYQGALDEFDEALEKPVTKSGLRRAIEAESQSMATQAAHAASGEADDAAALAGLRVLVAEDVPTNQLIMRDLLESEGVTVIVADNGAIAVEHMLANPDRFDAVVMDIQMPVMDGLEATRRIRAAGITVPIIALTAHAIGEESVRARAAGMDDFLTKPVEPESLIAAVQRLRAPRLCGAAPVEPSVPDVMNLPGINMELALRRMRKKPALLEKALRDFARRFDHSSKDIHFALAAGNVEEARRKAHSLKGSGGMVGAEKLSNAAAALEAHLIEGLSTDRDARLSEFDQALSEVIRGIVEAYPDLSMAVVGGDAPAARPGALLGRSGG